jgi:hypothetical protein
MKNDITVTFLNFLLVLLVICCVGLAILNMMRTHQLGQLQSQAAAAQSVSQRAQALANDVINYNATAKSQELNQILQSALAPQTPAAK